jgi:hypothetical protein
MRIETSKIWMMRKKWSNDVSNLVITATIDYILCSQLVRAPFYPDWFSVMSHTSPLIRNTYNVLRIQETSQVPSTANSIR